MRIGTKKMAVSFNIIPKRKWHSGIAILSIWKEYWDEEENSWSSKHGVYIPLFGKILD